MVDREYGPRQRLTTGELRLWAARSQGPDVSAQALLVYDAETQRILVEELADTPMAPASLTKLMTALLVLEAGNLQATATVVAEDLVGGTVMGLEAGETLTVEQLLWGLLAASGNDAAMTLARHTAGSVEAFVTLMNRRAHELGLRQTTLANPHGLDEDGHVSSARDLLALTLQVWRFPLVQEIVGSASAEVAGKTLLSTNQLLGTLWGANGVKTGTTDAAGQCLIAGIKRNGRQLFMVVLGSLDRYADVRTLYELYHDAGAAPTGDELSVLNRVYGADGQVRFLQPVGALPEEPVDSPAPPMIGYRRLDDHNPARWQPGEEVGVLEWRRSGALVATQALVVR
jgi:D-alanyl-D-alanine carboxypeptidase (penicillin-binding protein 5/6)